MQIQPIRPSVNYAVYNQNTLVQKQNLNSNPSFHGTPFAARLAGELGKSTVPIILLIAAVIGLKEVTHNADVINIPNTCTEVEQFNPSKLNFDPNIDKITIGNIAKTEQARVNCLVNKEIIDTSKRIIDRLTRGDFLSSKLQPEAIQSITSGQYALDAIKSGLESQGITRGEYAFDTFKRALSFRK